MGTVADYLNTIDGDDHDALARVYRIAREVVPDVTEGTGYGMAALLYQDNALIATTKSKKTLSLYPFSSQVISSLAAELSDFSVTMGSVHYSASQQIPEALVRKIIHARKAELDAR